MNNAKEDAAELACKFLADAANVTTL